VPNRCRDSAGAAPLRLANRFIARAISPDSVTKIDELQLEAKVVRAHRLNGSLQVVLVLAAHAHLALLHRGLHLELGFLQMGHDGSRLVDLDSVFELGDDSRATLASRFGLAHVEKSEGDLPLDQLLLNDGERSSGPILAAGPNRDGFGRLLDF